MDHYRGPGPPTPSGSTAHEHRRRSPVSGSRRRQCRLRHRGRMRSAIGEAASIIIAAPERCRCRDPPDTIGVGRHHHVPGYPPLDRHLPHRRLPQIPIAPRRPQLLRTSDRGFLPWRLSDAGPRAQPHPRDRTGIRNPSQQRTCELVSHVCSYLRRFSLARLGSCILVVLLTVCPATKPF